ncbi:MAG TPA: hypothetical protein VEU08_21615 [Vicinamibacterales bacterium]|nr:hypothetical protein [Vicinamibacterales bacterium]
MNLLMLAKTAVGFALAIFPVSLPLIVWLGLGVLTSPRGPDQPTGGWLVQLLPLPIPIVVLCVGAIYGCERQGAVCGYDAHVSAQNALNAVLFVHLALGLCLSIIARGSARVLGCAIQAGLFWCSYCAGFVSAMSITGIWI